MGLYDNITDQTKKLGVEAITKEHKVDLNMAVLIHDMAPTYGEAEVVKIIKDAIAAVRSQTLEGMKTHDQAKEKAELTKSL